MLKLVAIPCLIAALFTQAPYDALLPLLELPKFDPAVKIASLKRDATPVLAVMDALARPGVLSARYDKSVPELNKTCSVNLTDVSLEAALEAVLRRNGLDYTIMGPKEIFVFSATAANRERFVMTVRTFPIAKADPANLTQQLYKQVDPQNAPFRSIIIPQMTPPSIRVRAVGQSMASIAKFIAENDR